MATASSCLVISIMYGQLRQVGRVANGNSAGLLLSSCMWKAGPTLPSYHILVRPLPLSSLSPPLTREVQTVKMVSCVFYEFQVVLAKGPVKDTCVMSPDITGHSSCWTVF